MLERKKKPARNPLSHGVALFVIKECEEEGLSVRGAPPLEGGKARRNPGGEHASREVYFGSPHRHYHYDFFFFTVPFRIAWYPPRSHTAK